MADSRWEWSRAARRYRDTDSGKFLPAKTITTLRDNLVDARAREIARVTQEVADGKRQVVDWLVAMREQVKIATLAEYTFGRGGRNALEQSDFGRVGALVKAQYRYLDDFAAQLGAGLLSPQQATARAALYARAATAAHGRGLAAAWGVTLPQVPGDGQTECLTNCRCHLDIVETDTTIEVRWVVDPQAEHCPDCLHLGQSWSPLSLDKTDEEAA
jgi:hypothetical protein